MEAEERISDERPSKLRKLSQDGSFSPGQRLRLSEPLDGIPEVPNAESKESNATESATRPVPETLSGEAVPYESGNDDRPAEDPLPAPAEVAPLTGSLDEPSDKPALSKSQQKKMRRQLEWESKREDRKAIRKEKTVAKRERKRAAKQAAAADPPTQALVKQSILQRPVQLPVTFLIDCDFDGLMSDKERISLGAQLTRSYSDNKNAHFRAHVTVCSFRGKLRERFDTVLYESYKSWRGVRFLETDFVETAEKAKEWMGGDGGGVLEGAFAGYADEDKAEPDALKQRGEVVYLTSEANETLQELKPYSTYIIGGLVDKNREKGICYKRARARGVRTARLPIGEFMEMQSRKVLATNHVNEIMLKWLECGDWGEAFTKAIPKRKGGVLKSSKERGDGEEGEDEDGEDDGDGETVDEEPGEGNANGDEAPHEQAIHEKADFRDERKRSDGETGVEAEPEGKRQSLVRD